MLEHILSTVDILSNNMSQKLTSQNENAQTTQNNNQNLMEKEIENLNQTAKERQVRVSKFLIISNYSALKHGILVTIKWS